jgi:putative glutamine amidotransferase
MAKRPVVGLICDRRVIDGQPAHLVLEPYVCAVRDGAGALPLLIPVLDTPLDHDAVLAAVNGLLFTGSSSNVAPRHYGGPPARNPEFEDPQRDALTLPLIRMAIAAGLPTLAICRGTQELNVALGGTLHQHVQEIPGRFDHRERDHGSLELQYAPAHDVTRSANGVLAGLGSPETFQVNSLHGQGIDRLAPPLRIEATAPDGQIEAVSLRELSGFLLGLQWHPEWRWAENAVSRVIWAGFASALRSRS